MMNAPAPWRSAEETEIVFCQNPYAKNLLRGEVFGGVKWFGPASADGREWDWSD